MSSSSLPVQVPGVGLGKACSKQGCRRLSHGGEAGSGVERDFSLHLCSFPGPLAPNPCSAPGHGHMSSWVLRRPRRAISGLPLLVGADQSPDKGPELAGKDQGQSRPCPWGSQGLPQRLPWAPTAGRAMQGTPAQRTGTGSCLDFTTNEAALKSDAWLLELSGEKSRLLPTTLAAHHLPGRWVSAEGAGTISVADPLTSA